MSPPGSGAVAAAPRRRRLRHHRFDETIDQRPVLDDRAEEDQTVARFLVPGDGQQCPAEGAILLERLSSIDEPVIDAVVMFVALLRWRGRALIEIVDEVAGVDLEEPGQDLPGVGREMAPRTALDLGEIG